MQFIKLTKGTDAIKIFNNFGFFKLSTESGGEPELEATPSLVYTLSSDGTYYIVGTGFTSIDAIEADTSGGTNGSGLDSTWAGGQLVIPSEHNGLPVKAIAPRALATIKNITEMYIYDGITNIGHRAFQCATDNGGYDTTMKACRLPETLISLGGTTTNGAGRVFWGRQGLEVLNIPESLTHIAQYTFAYAVINKGVSKLNYSTGTFANVFYYLNSTKDYLTIELDFEINNKGTGRPTVKNMFYGAVLRNLTFNGFQYLGTTSQDEVSGMFTNAKVKCVRFNDLIKFNVYNKYNAMSMTSNKVYFPTLTSFSRVITADAKVDKIFFGSERCSMGSASETPSSKFFIKPEYIDWYVSATNWTAYFVNNGNEETRMFVYDDYASGDTLPTQIGTTQVYNVTWYEDDDFTVPAGSTATANKEYYGKISAVV